MMIATSVKASVPVYQVCGQQETKIKDVVRKGEWITVTLSPKAAFLVPRPSRVFEIK